MTKSMIRNACAVLAAATTTMVLFSAVASLADSDRAAQLAAQMEPTRVAVYTGAGPRR